MYTNEIFNVTCTVIIQISQKLYCFYDIRKSYSKSVLLLQQHTHLNPQPVENLVVN